MTMPVIIWTVLSIRLRDSEVCPRCGLCDTRPAHAHTIRGGLLRIVGCACYRCKGCKRRFYAGETDYEPVLKERTPARVPDDAEVVLEASPLPMPALAMTAETAPEPAALPEPVPASESAVAPKQVVPALARPMIPLAAAPGVPLDTSTRVRRRRRTNPSITPAKVAAIAACLIVAITATVWMNFPKSYGTMRVKAASKGAEPIQPTKPVRDFDLVVPEATLVAASDGRHIRGVLRNTGKRAYREVEVAFSADDRLLQPVQTVSVTVAVIAADSSVPFETGPLPAAASRFHLKEVITDKSASQ